jgi:VWFA-related protein
MRTRLSVLLCLIAAATLAAQDGGSQRDPAQPVFRSGASYIRVDMYVTQDGKPVNDIQASEIEVLEDGVLQKIDAFEHVQVPRRDTGEVRPEPDGVTASREAAADPRARVFVIFLDTYHTQLEGSANVRQPLVKFLERVLGPDDLVALMTPEMAASDITFGRNTDVISRILSDEWWGRRARVAGQDPQEVLYDSCGLQLEMDKRLTEELKARRREKLTLDALEDLVVHLDGVREERKAVLVVTEGWLLFGRSDELLQQTGRGPQPRTLGTFPIDRPNQGAVLSQFDCETDRMRLANLDHERRIREIGEDANRGNTTFYPVFARGLAVFDAPIGPDMPPSGAVDTKNLRTRHTNMRDLAFHTDGEAIIDTNNIDGALQRIANDLSSYYLLGYYSTNAKLDGRFRTITVRVKRPGTRVRARRGYRGRTVDELVSSTREPNPAAEGVASAMNRMTATTARSTFRIRPAAWARAADGGPVAGAAWVVGELDYRTRKELAWTAGAQAEVVILAADGTQVTSSTIAVPASQGSFGIRVPEEGTLAAGEYAVRVRLRSEADTDLVVDDTLRLIVPAAASPVGEAVMWRRGPTTGTQYLRTADPRFQRSDRIRLELPATGDGKPTGRMLDRLGNAMFVPVTISEKPDPSGEFRWIVADATLAPLTNGDYAIEVDVAGTKQITAFRVVP